MEKWDCLNCDHKGNVTENCFVCDAGLASQLAWRKFFYNPTNENEVALWRAVIIDLDRANTAKNLPKN